MDPMVCIPALAVDLRIFVAPFNDNDGVADSWYDVAEVCFNGHTSNSSTVHFSQHSKPFCDRCGAKTISACPTCSTPIRGMYHVPGVVGFSSYHPPAFCYQCGAEMPWTAASMNAARLLAEETEGLTDDERDRLAGTLDDLLHDSPMTQVAASRFKRLLSKAGHGTAESFRELLVDVVSEAAKRAIWGPGA
jgi:hypothetical protein